MSQNGKGDKWRGGWNQTYANNYEKIFGSKMKREKVNSRLRTGHDS